MTRKNDFAVQRIQDNEPIGYLRFDRYSQDWIERKEQANRFTFGEAWALVIAFRSQQRSGVDGRPDEPEGATYWVVEHV